MADITDPTTRSRMMAGIRGTNTKPELSIRRALHRRGFRFRLHDRELPGKPDVVLPKHGAVVLVHGCFWHRHGCSNSNIPSTRAQYWKTKLTGNTVRDRRNMAELGERGWRVAIVWECSIRHAERSCDETMPDRLAEWLRGGELLSEF